MRCTKKGWRKGDEWLLQFLSLDRDTGTGPQGGELTSPTFGAWAKLQYLLLQAKTGQSFTWSKLHLTEPQLPEIKLRHICKNLHCLLNLQRL